MSVVSSGLFLRAARPSETAEQKRDCGAGEAFKQMLQTGADERGAEEFNRPGRAEGSRGFTKHSVSQPSSPVAPVRCDSARGAAENVTPRTTDCICRLPEAGFRPLPLRERANTVAPLHRPPSL